MMGDGANGYWNEKMLAYVFRPSLTLSTNGEIVFVYLFVFQ